jgi:hypothetical protein
MFFFFIIPFVDAMKTHDVEWAAEAEEVEVYETEADGIV